MCIPEDWPVVGPGRVGQVDGLGARPELSLWSETRR